MSLYLSIIGIQIPFTDTCRQSEHVNESPANNSQRNFHHGSATPVYDYFAFDTEAISESAYFD